MKFKKAFKKSFDSFLYKSIDRILINKVYKNKKYSLLDKCASEMHNDLKNLLPEKNRRFFDELGEIQTQKGTIENYFIYQQGLIDGVTLKGIFFRMRDKDMEKRSENQ